MESILATGCRSQGPKKTTENVKNDAKVPKLSQIKLKNDAKISSEILVAVVFKIFTRYDYMYI